MRHVNRKHGIYAALAGAVLALQAFGPGPFSAGTDQTSRLDTTITPKNWPVTFGLGRHATPVEIRRLDIDVRPDGRGLPEGSGNVKTGQAIYQAKCLACHSGRGEAAQSLGPALITDSLSRAKTIGNYWPYASTVFDYINRSMPYNAPGTLTADEVYALTAYLLYANKIIPENAVMNASSLPKVKMPAEKLFVPDNRTGGSDPVY